MKWLLPVLSIFSLLFFSGCSHLFYQPSRGHFYSPKQLKIQYEDVEFETNDHVRLHGWYLPAQPTPGIPYKGVFVQFHGNAENISTHFISLAWVTLAGYDLFTFDYRGYGESQGSPSQAGLNEDALAAIQYVDKYVNQKFERKADRNIKNIKTSRPSSHPKPHIVLYGQSLGGAVLLRALTDLKERALPIRAVVIDSSFYSYQAVARAKLAQSFLTYLFQPLTYLLVSDAFSPEKAIEKVSPIPLLVIHGVKDQVVPIKMGEHIFELAKEPKTFWRIPDGHHIDSMVRHRGIYRDKLIDFLDKLEDDSTL